MSVSDSSIINDLAIDRWKQYIVTGNKCILNKEFNAAILQYEFARQYAETIFDKCLNPCEAASALVVTYHNIADLQRKLGNGSEIGFYLEKAHATVLRALIATPVNNYKHYALLDASKRTYKALVSYKQCGVYS